MPAHFLHSSISNDLQGLPQILSHRGFKGQYPENTICAIEGAIQAGTHALELDLHLTRDGEVVLSHVSDDATLGYRSKLIPSRTNHFNVASG